MDSKVSQQIRDYWLTKHISDDDLILSATRLYEIADKQIPKFRIVDSPLSAIVLSYSLIDSSESGLWGTFEEILWRLLIEESKVDSFNISLGNSFRDLLVNSLRSFSLKNCLWFYQHKSHQHPLLIMN